MILLDSLTRILSFSVANYTGKAEDALTVLNQWYNHTSGIWDTTGWWNSANCLTTLSNLALINSHVKASTSQILSNTYTEAQKYDFDVTKIVSNGMIKSFYGDQWLVDVAHHHRPTHNLNGFLNDYYDDEGWWALAWIQAFDLTGEQRYLNLAEDIFKDMAAGWTTPCGGIWWDKRHTYVSAISNELFLSVAAYLANRSDRKSYYVFWATREWSWFERSGMINEQYTINDGLDIATCENNNGIVWSYNQGVILGGLVELSRATFNTSLLRLAETLATSAIHHLTDADGILHDPCEPDCGVDGSQFKGVFMRNLQVLEGAVPNEFFELIIRKNADSIWSSARNAVNELSVVWSGPFISPANASTQSSASDALVAAAALRGSNGKLTFDKVSRSSQKLILRDGNSHENFLGE